ncbi:MAG: hypothetical protein CVV42_10915 [Candidatus Riflebacteria bacterium HGW-Riflebacteria-2]|nr:MAG: hypothetical protein CVV42_10915 [Candidatus Riflebacteria bacterium HGW-Riflebacteria-2]
MKKVGTLIGILSGLAGIAVGLYALFADMGTAAAQADLAAKCQLDKTVCIMATARASAEYGEAIGIAEKLHSGAQKLVFDPERFDALLEELVKTKPHYALIFILPDELDVNIAWKWLIASTKIDDDPFVDIRTGFMTGATPAMARAFMQRIVDVHEGRLKLPGKMIDQLGGNTEMAKPAFQQMAGSFMIPVYAERFGVETISHGVQGFSQQRLSSLNDAGILHFGGHGYPDRIVDTLNGVYVRKLALSPCVVFNGACYTGVTGRWFDVTTGKLAEKRVEPDLSFALGMLEQPVVGYLAALHPDHGIPVYQEMEYLACSGATLGDAIKHTHDGVVLGNGGIMPDLPTLGTGMQLAWTPKDIMLKGTAARILFGDPTLAPMPSFAREPFALATTAGENGSLKVVATLKNPSLKATYTNTFENGLSGGSPFNDRALLKIELPKGQTTASDVRLDRIVAGGSMLQGQIVGYAVEQDDDRNFLHVHIDVPSTAYMAGLLRQSGNTIELSVDQ